MHWVIMQTNPHEGDPPSVVRRCSRGKVAIDLAVDAHSEHNLWCGLSNDVAEGGVFVATHESLEPGTNVDLSVRLPGVEEPVALRGVVRWIRAYGEESDAPAGVGVKFVALDQRALPELSRFATLRDPILFELDEPATRPRRRN
jgi:uncharacterized protein (TIGR02266 family)